jgi:hypothetical protein
MAIDREKIITELSKVRVGANAEGLIPEMGVYIQQLPTEFWDKFSADLLLKQPEALRPKAEEMLGLAAQECGYHTGHGIINSDVWKEVVGPMIEKVPEDIIHGAFAVCSAWGWALSEVVDLVPGEEAVIRAVSYYEATGARNAGINRPFAHMLRGVCAAFMDLAYGPPYPSGLGTFACVQTKGIEVGDQYGEFVVRRKR